MAPSTEEQRPHFLLVTFPAQGHLNPALQFAKRLVRGGARVTFSTSVSAYRRMGKGRNVPEDLTFAAISDGYDDGFKPTDGDVHTYVSKFRECGSTTLAALFEKCAAEGNHISCLVYTILLPWAAEVAREFDVASALLWIQPATVFDIYYYYFKGYEGAIGECEKDPSWELKLPNMPFQLKARDLPSFLLPSTPYPYTFALPSFKEQIEMLEKQDNPTILINTFQQLESKMLSSIQRFRLLPVGPLLPSAFVDGRDPTEKAFGADLFQGGKQGDYMEWLDSQPKSSVIYVSFGSISVLSKPQAEELATALIQTQSPFLWVIRDKDNNEHQHEEDDVISCMPQLNQQGLIVPWCSQVEVLSHPSVGCFVTHCGWNSTLESLTSGVPMVGFPQWSDQTTNAKLVQDVWKTGVRVKPSQDEEDDGLVKSEEIHRCLDLVMDSDEMKENARVFRTLAIQANQQGGSSDTNLKAFINQIWSQHT